MKKIFLLITLLIILLFPSMSFATLQYTTYDGIFYDDETGGYWDTSSRSYLDLSFVPSDIEIRTDFSLPDSDPSIVVDPNPIIDAVCECNGVQFSTITDAFNSIDASQPFVQIDLYEDAYIQSSLIIPEGCHVTVILNDYSIIGECNYDFIANGDLSIIGSGNIINTLGGGIYNLGLGTVRLQNCAVVSTKSFCLVNNQDGSIYVQDNCSLVSEDGITCKQLKSGAGSIVDDTAPIDPEPKTLLLNSPLPDSENGPLDNTEDLEDEDFDGIVDGGIEVINRVAALLITPPWIYIAVFTLICIIAVVVKFKFM